MIYFRIAWDSNKNLVKAYNHEMSLIPNDNDFCCFIDRDAIFLDAFFGYRIEQYIEKYPECRCFTGKTNRLHPINTKQVIPNFRTSNDVYAHKLLSDQIISEENYTITDFSIPEPCHMGGFLICIRKDLWKEIGGFKAWSNESNILGIDSRLHQNLYERKEKLYVMNSVYLYHIYRFDTNNKNHLL